MIDFAKKKSLLNNKWEVKNFDERESLLISQKFNLSPILSKLLNLRKVNSDNINNYLNPNFNDNLPDPFVLKDMNKSVKRTVNAIQNKEKIGIVADYDVDGSTSAAILYNFLSYFKCDLSLKIPDRLNEGYGPNKRIMNEFLKEKIDLIFTLDCGTSSFGIIDNLDYSSMDTIVIDHHISENILPKVYTIINPNRYDESNNLKDLAAVGVTFLFLLGLRKQLRSNNFFVKNYKEPNLLNFLDLVALGTVCDVVSLRNFNRNFVIKGLEIIKKRTHIGIKSLIDNSKIKNTPTSSDLSFIVGPQLNAASRINDSSLASKFLITNNLEDLEKISKKLLLLNEKRKLIENQIFDEAFVEASKQISKKILVVSGFGWHTGVLGIIASRLSNEFYKPAIVISFNQKYGVGSARSIKGIDLGNIIIQAKEKGILIKGGGHKMAAGLLIKKTSFNEFNNFLFKHLDPYNDVFFEKKVLYDAIISIDEINIDFIENIEKLEPFGNDNEEPKFIIKDMYIKKFKILNNKHIMIFLESPLNANINGICFNSVDTPLGQNFINNKTAKYAFGCIIKKNNFNSKLEPQIIIKDAMVIN